MRLRLHLQSIFMLRKHESPSRSFRSGVIRIYALLVSGTIAVWISTLVAFRNDVILLGTAFLAFSLGLRHAVDADHITAIDNVTRTHRSGCTDGIKLLPLYS
jgi:nickel/cobalt transporter (NiCoT) family protein